MMEFSARNMKLRASEIRINSHIFQDLKDKVIKEAAMGNTSCNFPFHDNLTDAHIEELRDRGFDVQRNSACLWWEISWK